MIRWCSYCQCFLGEVAPYDDPRFTHSICGPCVARLERDESLLTETEPAREVVRRLIDSAARGDHAACEAVLGEAVHLAVQPDSLLVAILQPALYQAGLEWQAARMSVAAEHRLTSWCDWAFNALPVPPPRRPLDVLIFQTPGNAHTLGPRFAARVLAGRGLSAEAIVPALPLEEMVHQARVLRPRCIGLSCALPDAVPVAQALVARLRERLARELECRWVLSGFAFRMGGSASLPHVDPGIEVVIDLAGFCP